MKQNTILILVVALVLVGLVYYKCMKSPSREGYIRSSLANDCFGLQRSPVDYAFKFDHGWQRNPHWQASPGNKFQPLDYGPIDLFADERRLVKNHGTVFQQYRSDWKGCGQDVPYLVNDEKTRFDLTNIGDQGARDQLDNIPSVRFGPPGYDNNERSMDRRDNSRGKIYGGSAFLKFDRLGD